MKALALTGGIATGKSTVAKMFRKLGATVLDADTIAHETYAPNTPLYQKILTRYGHHLAKNNGPIDRQILGKILFHDPKEKQWLEAQIHPATRAKIAKNLKALQQQKSQPPLVLVEAALHVESGLYKDFAGLIVVNTTPEIQLKSLQAREGLNLEQAQIKLANQISLAEKKQHATWVIENSGTLQETQKQVEKLYQKLTKS